MSVGFIVMAHSEPKLLGALLRELDPYPTFLHVDRPKLTKEYLDEAGFGMMCGLVLNEQARCLHWGGYSILQAMLETLELALGSTGSETKHFAFLSGQCFPLRPVADFVEHVEGLEHPVLCRAIRLDGEREMGPRRVMRRHWLDGAVGHAKKVGPRKAVGLLRRVLTWSTAWSPVRVPDIEHACGSQWCCIPRQLAKEVVEHYQRGDFNYLRNAYAPDEIAIPSFIYNSYWKFQTQARELEEAAGKDVSAFSNFHWLRSKLQGTIDAQDVQHGQNSNNFFIRKMAASNYDEMTKAIKACW